MSAFEEFRFLSGHVSSNRFMLSPLTNTQSHEDGRLSNEEKHWLTMRAKGGFGMVMTCAANIQKNGQGFPGQLGIFDDIHKEGHLVLTEELRSLGSLSLVQLYHGGMRADSKLTQEAPVCPSPVERKGARGMTLSEIHEVRDNFIRSADLAKQWGYDGVELHGAHGYLLAQYISPTINLRTDDYGGNLNNRSRLLIEILSGIRKVCGDQFMLGVRLSPERFGMLLGEIKELTKRMIKEDLVDFLDLSLWDCFKFPEEEEHKDVTLIDHFASLDRKDIKMTVAGNIRSGQDVYKVLDKGIDFVTIGRAGILHHDFPQRVRQDSNFEHVKLPVSPDYLANEGLSERFIQYMGNWPGFVKR